MAANGIREPSRSFSSSSAAAWETDACAVTYSPQTVLCPTSVPRSLAHPRMDTPIKASRLGQRFSWHCHVVWVTTTRCIVAAAWCIFSCGLRFALVIEATVASVTGCLLSCVWHKGQMRRLHQPNLEFHINSWTNYLWSLTRFLKWTNPSSRQRWGSLLQKLSRATSFSFSLYFWKIIFAYFYEYFLGTKFQRNNAEGCVGPTHTHTHTHADECLQLHHCIFRVCNHDVHEFQKKKSQTCMKLSRCHSHFLLCCESLPPNNEVGKSSGNTGIHTVCVFHLHRVCKTEFSKEEK